MILSRNSIAALLPTLLLLSACDKSVESVVDDQAPKGLDKAWATFAKATRSTDVDTWDMYDQIGISMCYHCPESHPEAQEHAGIYYDPHDQVTPFNCCYYTTTAGSSEFTYYGPQHRIWFPTDSTTVDFVSYYPYSDQLTQASHQYPIDLSQQTTSGKPLSAYDLMWGSIKGLDKANTAVVIPFYHQLTQVICYIKPIGDLTVSELEDATVAISNQKMQAQMDVLTSQLQYGETTGDLQLMTRLIVVDGDSCLEAKAIMLPNHPEQNPVAYTPTDDLQASLVHNRHILLYLPSMEGRSLSANIKETEFKPGEKHVFRLEAQVSQLSLLTGEIVEWQTIEHDDVSVID